LPGNFEKEDSSFSKDINYLRKLCLNMVRQRYEKEYNLVSSLMIEKANLALKNMWKDYTMKEIVVKDWTRLLEKFSKFL
jgi:hypothetical protein